MSIPEKTIPSIETRNTSRGLSGKKSTPTSTRGVLGRRTIQRIKEAMMNMTIARDQKLLKK